MSQPETDLGRLLQQAVSIRDQVLSMRDQLPQERIVGSTGDGSVEITATADGEFQSVWLDPTRVGSCEPEELADLVLKALRHLTAQLRERADEKIAPLQAMLSEWSDG